MEGVREGKKEDMSERGAGLGRGRSEGVERGGKR